MGISVSARDGNGTAILDPGMFAATPNTSAAAWASDQFIVLPSNAAWSVAPGASPAAASAVQNAPGSQASNTSLASAQVSVYVSVRAVSDMV
jgi:hypothetical protein